jgi:hypothetical protein
VKRYLLMQVQRLLLLVVSEISLWRSYTDGIAGDDGGFGEGFDMLLIGIVITSD